MDIIAHVHPDDRRCGRRRWAWIGLRVLLGSSGFHVTTLYRLAHVARHRLGPLGRVLAGAIFWLVRHGYGCSIATTARLHGGLILPHPQGIVIGPGVVVGPRSWIFQNVTLGGVPGKPGAPRVGADARLYAGAVLVGPITVGDAVMVGANAVVARDVPSRSAVYAPRAEGRSLEDGG
jgi:serine O-acetyltransferase